MGRRKGFRGDLEILKLLAREGRPMSMKEISEKLGLNKNAVWYWLGDPRNEDNLVSRGCVVKIRKKDYTLNRAQDMYLFEISEYGRKNCLPPEEE